MKMSRSVRYAILSLVHLAQADPQRHIMAKEISREHDIPLEYLLKILLQLTRSGLLKSVRGPQGGFALNLSASQITCFDIIETVEGPLFDSGNSAEQAHLTTGEIKLAKLYHQVGKKTTQLLKETTLRDLAAS